MEVEHHHAELGDVRLHYVTAGVGPPVVLLHGWPETWYMWRGVIPALAARHRVIAPDLRGLGDSSRPARGYDKLTVASDIARLMGSLGHDRYCVGAHDWGAPVAFALAAQNRGAVRAMTIFDAPVPGDGGPDAFNRWHHLFHSVPELPEALVEGREALYLSWFYRAGGATPGAIPAEVQAEYVRAYSAPGAMRAGFEYYRAWPQDCADNARLIAADGPLTMPIRAYGGGAASGRGNAALESWRRVGTQVEGGAAAGAGHWIPEELPDWSAARMLELFAAAP